MATPTRSRKTRLFSDEEMSAMRDRATEVKSSFKRTPEEERAAGEAELRAKVADMPEPDRSMAERLHELISREVPSLVPRTYYGMPAYAKDGRTICFFKPKSKFKMRYATFGFQPDAALDDGTMWPTEFALTELTPANEARIVDLVNKAIG
jgi:uncharacterized protein YdhG (YjbR/CyaY superfamily)